MATTSPPSDPSTKPSTPATSATAITTPPDPTDTTHLADSVTGSLSNLKARIKAHYDLCSPYYYSLWGEHIHHGYFVPATLSKEAAQTALIDLLLARSQLAPNTRVLDVGCGIGGTSRYLARERGCRVTGVTISGEQVRMALRLSGGEETEEGFVAVKKEGDVAEGKEGGTGGEVRFVELDAAGMGDHFRADGEFDAVWISEALSHFPDKKLFFRNALDVLKGGGAGKLVLADWFREDGLSEAQVDVDIKPIEHGMLLPPLSTQSDYVAYAKEAGFQIFAEPFDISQDVAKTWDISLSLVADPSLWALALSQGRDFIAFLKAFQAMRNGYKNGTFRYAVMVFEKKA